MKVRYSTDVVRYKTLTAQQLRESFLIPDLFKPGEICLEYFETERAVVGSAVPTEGSLKLQAGKELASEYFCERREIGVLNIGGAGKITVDDKIFDMANLDCLYIGRGSKKVEFASVKNSTPAKYYLLSYPAHVQFPTTHVAKSDAQIVRLGSTKEANVRTLHKYIHPGGVKSAQLVMGFTVLDEGSVWNTMPAHTHERRTEVYLYFNMAENAMAFHLMGEPEETRHIIVRNEQAAISPMWSIHSGVGTGAYCFCWGMGGENQNFDDMDPVAPANMK